MGYRLLALDMDGTLLDSEKRISQKTWEALGSLSERGVALSLCTGRNPQEALWPLGSSCGPIRFGVLISGALVYDFENSTAISSRPIDSATAKAVVSAGEAEGAMVSFLCIDGCICRKRDADRMDLFHMGIYQEMYQHIYRFEDDLAAYIEKHPGTVAKINLYHRDTASRGRSRMRLSGLPLRLADAEETSLECSPEGISKAAGLLSLSQHLGIPLDDMVAIGDAPNDLDALHAAGCAVAMGNATAEVKAAADLIVADNDHDGIVEAIERLF